MDASRPPSNDRSKEAIKAAVRYIAIRGRSAAEVREKLRTKGFETDEIDRATGFLLEAGYLDDERFARECAGSRARNKHWGKERIRAELRSKGIAPDLIAGCLAGMDDESERATAQSAFKCWTRKTGKGAARSKLDKNGFARAMRFLLGRGFSPGVAKAAIRGSGPAEED